MCPLTNCHIWLIFATPLMGDEPPPPECQPICVLTHTCRILGLPSGPHQYLCVVCLKTFRIGLFNFAYLSHIIHNISNTCQSVAYLPITQQASPLPRQYLQTQDQRTANSLSGKKNKSFVLVQKTGLQYLQTKQTATRLFETGKFVQVQKLSKIKI